MPGTQFRWVLKAVLFADTVLLLSGHPWIPEEIHPPSSLPRALGNASLSLPLRPLSSDQATRQVPRPRPLQHYAFEIRKCRHQRNQFRQILHFSCETAQSQHPPQLDWFSRQYASFRRHPILHDFAVVDASHPATLFQRVWSLHLPQHLRPLLLSSRQYRLFHLHWWSIALVSSVVGQHPPLVPLVMPPVGVFAKAGLRRPMVQIVL
mmetsp:Transcript_130140/g.376518  ORF Transcript_130140/g.376518 Transcript_130140/m.376518 type:complete len:207 (-) Transcript_130140:112-732(-)